MEYTQLEKKHMQEADPNMIFQDQVEGVLYFLGDGSGFNIITVKLNDQLGFEMAFEKDGVLELIKPNKLISIAYGRKLTGGLS